MSMSPNVYLTFSAKKKNCENLKTRFYIYMISKLKIQKKNHFFLQIKSEVWKGPGDFVDSYNISFKTVMNFILLWS